VKERGRKPKIEQFKQALLYRNAGLTMDKACERAGISKQTFYNILDRALAGKIDLEPELMRIARRIREGEEKPPVVRVIEEWVALRRELEEMGYILVDKRDLEGEGLEGFLRNIEKMIEGLALKIIYLEKEIADIKRRVDYIERRSVNEEKE